MADELDMRLEPRSLHVTPAGFLQLAGYDKTRVESFCYMLNALGSLLVQRMPGCSPALCWVGGVAGWTIAAADDAAVKAAVADTREHRKVAVRPAGVSNA